GETTVGRFDQGDSMTMQCVNDFRLYEIKWREFDGDEKIHISWTSGGVANTQVFNITETLTLFQNFTADGGTPVVITNVTPDGSPLSGRLRIEYMKAALLYSSAPYYDHSGPDGFVQMAGVNLAGAEFSGFAF